MSSLSILDSTAPHSRSLTAQLDPRLRIVMVVVFAVVVVTFNQVSTLVVALLMALGALLLARLPVIATLKRVLVVDSFIVLMLLTLPFTTPGEPAFTMLSLPASWQGLTLAAVIALRANAIVMMMLALLSTLTPVALGYALARLRVPVSLIHLLLFTVRYIDVLFAEYKRLLTAIRARGFVLRSDLHTYRSVGYLFGMLLVRGLERSHRILDAMKCRGFAGQFYLLDDLRYRLCDAAALVIALSALTLLGVLEWWL